MYGEKGCNITKGNCIPNVCRKYESHIGITDWECPDLNDKGVDRRGKACGRRSNIERRKGTERREQ